MKRPKQIPLPSKGWLRIAVGVLVLAVVAAGALIGVKHFSGLPDDAAFEYRDTVVTKAALNDRVEVLKALYGIKEPADSDGKDDFRRATAKAVAVSLILDHAADEREIVVADKAARDTLAKMVNQQLGPDGTSEFTKILGEFGVNEDQVLSEIKRQQSIARLFQDVTQDAVASVTPAVVKAYFDDNAARFATPEQRRIRNVVVATRAEAKNLLDRLGSGAGFASLAKQTSLDESTRSSGGDLGTVAVADLETSYGHQAFSTPDGGIFGPIETSFGWNVGQVVTVTPGRPAVFDEVSSAVRDVVRAERAMDAWRAFVADEIKRADVTYADSYRPDDPDAPPTDFEQPGVPSVAPGTEQ